MLEFLDVSHSYNGSGGSVKALKEVSIKVNEGEFVCVLGPSGSGKTSLLNMAAGFIRPDTGKVMFRGSEVEAPGRERAVVFQDLNLLPWLSVEENIRLALKTSDEKEKKRKTAEVLETVGLRGFDKARPSELSGGMKQKVAIARALVMDSPLLLMDEPFGSLDEQTRLRLNRELVAIWKKSRKTIFFITHSIQEAIVMGTRIVLLSVRPGQVIKEWDTSGGGIKINSEEYLRISTEIHGLMQLCCPPLH